MKIALVAALLAFSGLAHADLQMANIEGAKAEKLMQQLIEDPSTEWLENTTAVTVISNHAITCTLRGNHAASAAALGGEQYSCEVPADILGSL